MSDNDFPDIIPVLSPHYNARRVPRKVQVIVLHADASPNEQATLRWLQHPDAKVSYHILIGRTGTAYRIVADAHRAWANGQAKVLVNGTMYHDVNNVALNLSFANAHNGKEPLTAAQIATAEGVLRWWRDRHGPLLVTTHAAIALPLGRKTDPLRIPNFRLDHFVR